VTHAVIGAGFAGLPVAKRLIELGEDVEILDRNDGIGGLWHTGVYESAHLISSRRSTSLPDYPMPESWPDFPSRNQVREYLQAYAREFGMASHVRSGVEVTRVRPDPHGDAGSRWLVDFADGMTKAYATVTLATGHFSTPRELPHDGEFDGEIIRSGEYRDDSVFAGKRVLVVGYGNTGCDAAVDVARVTGHADISMRSGTYFLPKTFLGIPMADFGMYSPIKTDFTDRLVARAAHRLSVGDLGKYGISKPAFRILDKHPVLNSELLHLIRHGRVTVRPDIARLDGSKVHFVDGHVQEYDMIFYATGYRVDYPMLREEDHVIERKGDLPILLVGTVAPLHRGLFFVGLGQARTGGGPLFQSAGYSVARLAALDAHSSRPVPDLIRESKRAQFLEKRLKRRLERPADMRSKGLGEVQRGLKWLAGLCDEIGAPTAPIRSSRMQDVGTTPSMPGRPQ